MALTATRKAVDAQAAGTEILACALVCLLSAFSARNMAVFGICKPAVDATSQSIFLPPRTVLEKFPCEGGPIAQLQFLARHALKLNVELLRLRGDLVWASWSQAFWLLRFLSALLLPHALHVAVAAPLCTYLTRATPLVALLLAGPSRGLSQINGYFLFGFGAVGDAFLSLTQPTLHMWPELLYNALSLLAVAVLSTWHGASFPDLPSRLDQQVLLRLALAAGVHWYALRRCRARDAAAGRRSRSSSGSGAEVGDAASSAGSTVGASEAAAGALSPGGGGGVAMACRESANGLPATFAKDGAKAGSSSSGSSSSSSCSGAGAGRAAPEGAVAASGAAVHLPGVPAALHECAVAAAVAGGPQHRTCEPKSPAHSGEPAPAGANKPLPATIRATATGARPAGAASPRAGASAAAESVAAAIRAAQQCVAEADADPVPALSMAPPPYRSVVRRRTTRIKIPGCEPGQIGAGFTQRLQTLAAERGVMLSGVYVREGCIELVLDELYWQHNRGADAGRARGAVGHSSAAAAVTTAGATGDMRYGFDSGHLDSDHLIGEEVVRGAQLAEAAAVLAAPPAVLGPGAAAGHDVSSGVQALLGELERELAAWEGAWGVMDVTTADAELGLELEEQEQEGAGGEVEAEALEEVLVGVPRDLRRRGNSPPIASEDGGVVPWSLDAVVDALHLSPEEARAAISDRSNSNSSIGSSGPGVSTVNVSAVTQQQALMGRAAAAARGSDSAFDLHEPLVVELQPRGLLLPPPSAAGSAAAGAAGGGAALGDEAEQGKKPVARLRAVVSGHAPFPGVVTVTADAVADADRDAAEAPPVEVLLRCCGEYLGARVVTSAAPVAEDATEVPATVYDIELLQRPKCPPFSGCVLMLELRPKGRLGHILPVLLLSGGGADDGDAAAVVTELQALAAAAYGMRAASSTRNCLSVGELDDLLLDLGTWMAAPTATAVAATAAATTAAGGVSPRQRLQLDLGASLLRYADASGALPATARRLRGDLARAIDDLRRSRPPAAAPTAVPEAAADAVAAAAAAAAGEGAGASAAPPAAAASTLPAACPAPGAVPRPCFVTAVREALGIHSRAGAEAEADEAAYQAYAEPLIFAQGHVIQAVEALSLAALLFRARHDLLSPGNLTTLSGCCTGTATSLAWLLLPRPAWTRLVNGAKVPRYLLYMLSKLMIGCLGFPTPPGLIPYQLGSAMLVMEGVLLPGSCLLPLPAALAITLLKWPLAIAMMRGSGAAADLLTAALTTFRVVLLALATTVLCHAYLRYSFRFQRWRRWQAAAGGAGVAAGLRGAAARGVSGAGSGSGSGGGDVLASGLGHTRWSKDKHKVE